MLKKLLFGLAVCWFVLLAVPRTRAQVTTATVVGTVTDHSGAVVPNAQATITNTGTNFTRTVGTNSEGQYRFDLLPVGHYTLDVTAPGFKKFNQTGVLLTLNQTARLNVVLEVGSVAEEVTVTAATPTVNTSTGEVGTTVENAQIVNLPLVNRDVYQLLELTPGFQHQEMDQTTLGIQQQLTFMNGGADGGLGSTSYYLDGGLNMTGVRETGNAVPSPDAVQEFRVQTNSFSAVYGRTKGTVVNVITKSGTNDVHGSVFEFARNTIFNSNNWASTGATPPYHRNQFGGTVGGPIKKNKIFYFASYDGLRQITPNFRNNVVVPYSNCGASVSASQCVGAAPGAGERGGDFSSDLATTGNSKKPFTVKDPIGGGATFTNNQIPANMLDPTSQYIMANFVPLANEMDSVTGRQDMWQGFVAPTPNNYDEGLGKIDFQLTPNQLIEGSYFINQGFTTNPQGNLPNWGAETFAWRQQNINLSHTWTISANKLNQGWLSYTRNFGGRTDTPAISLSDITAAACATSSPYFQSTPCSGPHYMIQGTPAHPNISVSGYFSLSNAIAGPKTGTNLTSFRDVFSWTHGRHAFQFGGEVGNDNDEQQVLLDNWGVFSFAGGAKNSGNNLADFELGLQSSQEQDAPVTPYTNSNYFALFAQDDFRLTPRLTLNLGVRWDVQTPPTDKHKLASTFVAGVQSTVQPAAPTGQLFIGDPGVARGIVPVRWHHVQPRIGIAWDPTGSGKTAIRGGFGVFYGQIGGNDWNMTSNFEPFSIRLSTWPNIFAKGNNPGTYASLTNPYNGFTCGGAAAIPFPYPNPTCGAWVTGGNILGVSPNFQWPYTYELNLSVQHEFAHGFTIGAAYVGSLSHDLPIAVDLNYPLYNVSGVTPSSKNVNQRRPIDNPTLGVTNSAFGQVFQDQSTQTASYNALQVTFSEKLGRAFSLQGYYTYSKSLESVELDNNTPNPTASGQIPQDYLALREERGASNFDQRHSAVVSFVWLFSYYSGQSGLLRGLLNGWTVSPIISAHSGLPFTITSGSDFNLDGVSGNDRPNRVPATTVSVSNRGPSAWFNTAAFCDNNGGTKVACPAGVVGAGPNGQDGNLGRNSLYGPHFYQWDMALSRDFKIHERLTLQARAEALNVFNLVNLNNPGTTLGTNTFGVISGAGTMRELQLGLRLTF
ncbi:MAG TPA: TonB-dependent receptor [Candidatus Acidoferrales bacterium]|nr:TonB-dependent receptor [Candidatus Acidoferrales bacterium]